MIGHVQKKNRKNNRTNVVENSGWEEGSIACDELLSFYKDAARDNPQLVAKNLRLLGLAEYVQDAHATQGNGVVRCRCSQQAISLAVRIGGFVFLKNGRVPFTELSTWLKSLVAQVGMILTSPFK